MFNSRLGRIVIYVLILIGAVFICAVMYLSATHRAFRIPTAGMMPNLQMGDFLYGKKVDESYQPRQGDILVFKYPNNQDLENIKRCVAVAGDTVAVTEGILFINGEIYESNLADPDGDHSCVPGWDGQGACPAPFTLRDSGSYARGGRRFNQWPRPGMRDPYVVPAGHIFMMGDNRYNSEDSRHWGSLDIDLIVAKASFFYWNAKDLSRIGKKVR